jgi:hypothetical protein
MQQMGLRTDDFSSMQAPQRSKRMLLADMRRGEAGALGPSEAEKRQDVSRTMQAGDAATNANLAELGRQNLTATGTGVSGQLAAQQQGVLAGADAKMAKVSADVNAKAQDIAAQQAADLKARLERQQDRARENAQLAVQSILEGAKASTGTATAIDSMSRK